MGLTLGWSTSAWVFPFALGPLERYSIIISSTSGKLHLVQQILVGDITAISSLQGARDLQLDIVGEVCKSERIDVHVLLFSHMLIGEGVHNRRAAGVLKIVKAVTSWII